MKVIRIEVITPVLESYGLCVTCQALIEEAGLGETVQEYPQEWKEDFRRVVDWMLELSRRYGDKVQIRFIDPRSLQGFFRCIRYGITRYPSFVIEKRKYYVGWDKEALEKVIEELLEGSEG